MIKGRHRDIRSMLRELGTTDPLCDISIPSAWLIPGAADPDSAGVVIVNKALQRGLKKVGYEDVLVNGIIDVQTASALDHLSPPDGSWMHKTYVYLLAEVIEAVRHPSRVAKRIAASSLAGYFEVEGGPYGPIPGSTIGQPPGPLGIGATSVDSGISLEFGQSKKKTSFVPIPKSSGTTFHAFTNLQRQINRLLSKSANGGRIDEDGILGKGTFAGFKRAQTVVGMSLAGDESLLALAKNSVSTGSILRSEADSLGISPNANKGASVTSASLKEPTPLPMTKGEMSSFSGGGVMSAVKQYVPFLALAGAVAWYASSTKKKTKKRRKTK